jgi:hypothetical protein
MPRAGSVPVRSTTPVNSLSHYVPVSTRYSADKNSTVIPASRPGSSMGSNSVPNKRRRVGEPTSGRHASALGGQQRAPLGTHRGQAVNVNQLRTISPVRGGVPGKTPTNGSSLPRPVAMPMPKTGTQYHLLGHGRLPSSNGLGDGAGYRQPSQQLRTASAISTVSSNARVLSSTSSMYRQNVTKKASRAKRESFKPRPSVDGSDVAISIGIKGGRRGLAGTVKEDEEVY